MERNVLKLKIREELLKDFYPLRHLVKRAFVEADNFYEMAFDYYKCKQLLTYLERTSKYNLINDYQQLKYDLHQEINEYLSKKEKI